MPRYIRRAPAAGRASPQQDREIRLAETFVRLADSLVGNHDVVDLLDELTRTCVTLLDVSAAGLLLTDQRAGLRLLASSSEDARLLEVFQLQSDSGPCLDCFQSGDPVNVPDLAVAVDRWPQFVPVAAGHGFHAVHALPLRLREQTIGALNLFHAEPLELSEADGRIAQALADVATIGILQQRTIHHGTELAEQLQTALNTRTVIEQAKGVLAERASIDKDRAFALIRGYSRAHNRRLADVALAIGRRELAADEVLRQAVRPPASARRPIRRRRRHDSDLVGRRFTAPGCARPRSAVTWVRRRSPGGGGPLFAPVAPDPGSASPLSRGSDAHEYRRDRGPRPASRDRSDSAMTAPTRTVPRGAGQAGGSDYAALSRQIRSAGLLRRRPGAYAVHIAVVIAFFGGTCAAIGWLGDSWYQTILAVVLGIAFTQVAFLGHDGGHQQVFARRRANDLLGQLTGDLLVGLSYGWWIDKHNRHHANPNKEEHDPDIGDGVLVFTTGQVAARTGWLGRAILRRQAWLFFPLLTFEGFSLHVGSVRSLLPGAGRSARGGRRWTELLLLSVHLVGYVGGLLLVMSPVKALVFAAIHQGVFGLYMGCSFAPNHKGMLTLAADADLDYLRRQVLTSRNVRGGVLTDLALGGLNYQIEHHLFPNMPRPSLRRAQRLIRAYCAEHGVGYTETSLFGSYAAALQHLNQLGAPLRGHRPA